MYQASHAMTTTDAATALTAGMQAIESGETDFDLAAVTAVDSAAVAVLLAWRRAAQARDARLDFCNPTEALCSLAALYGVSELLRLPTHEVSR